MRKVIVISWLMILAVGVAGFFWYNEWKYNLPTPVPANYIVIHKGNHIDISAAVNFNNNKPVFIHFFNPDCPCSKFNIPHFKSLVKTYNTQANFVIVIMSIQKFTQKQIQDKFDLDIPVVFDSSIAAKCGVYSTPQAVILDNNHNLFYRGNYNRSRYCNNSKSNYAQIALDSLLHNNRSIVFNQYALVAYGCELPNYNNKCKIQK